jgi:peroxiredoxin
VIGVSVDADTTLANWARESSFPVLFASDPGGLVGKSYAAYDAKNQMDNRSLFVVAPDGRIAYIEKPFKVLSPASYAALGHAVDSLSPMPAPAAKAAGQ